MISGVIDWFKCLEDCWRMPTVFQALNKRQKLNQNKIIEFFCWFFPLTFFIVFLTVYLLLKCCFVASQRCHSIFNHGHCGNLPINKKGGGGDAALHLIMTTVVILQRRLWSARVAGWQTVPPSTPSPTPWSANPASMVSLPGQCGPWAKDPSLLWPPHCMEVSTWEILVCCLQGLDML